MDEISEVFDTVTSNLGVQVLLLVGVVVCIVYLWSIA